MADRPSEIRYGIVDTAAVGATLMVATEAEYRVCFLSLCLHSLENAQAVVGVTVEDIDGTNRLGPYNLLDGNNPLVLPQADNGWFCSGPGQGVQLLLAGAVRVVCSFTYRMIPNHFRY